ncbi:hypothetical protein D6C00_06110 [Thiohalobacter thiocyanaticus]|uniref:Uncharacterized protein n=1 Tax=Thiohalobacter thiocyanaticus TaxID=585455 RepID=A0A426QIG4_9GAMM|nr:hypothetical protein D6C00_06110 [Thiohalobacter thiocyanaticus]
MTGMARRGVAQNGGFWSEQAADGFGENARWMIRTLRQKIPSDPLEQADVHLTLAAIIEQQSRAIRTRSEKA